MEKSEGVSLLKNSFRTFKSRYGTVLIEGDAGNFTSITLYNRAIVHKPGLTITTGVIPDEHKRIDAMSYSFTGSTRKDVAAHSVEHDTAMVMQDFSKNQELTRLMEEEKLGLDRDDQQPEQQKQEEYNEEGGQYVEDGTFKGVDPTEVTFTIDRRFTNEGQPPPFLPITEEDIIPPKQVWFTFISRGGYRYLGRYVGRFFFVSQYEGVIINKPGAVAAVGGIPDELKIEGGISFSYPAPIYKFPRTLRTSDPELHKFDHSLEDMGKELCCKALTEAYSKAVGVRLIRKDEKSEDEDSEDEEDYMDELFPTSIVVNLATPRDIEQLNPSIWPMVTQSVMIKYLMEEQHMGGKLTSEDGKEPSIQAGAAHKKARVGSSSMCKEEEVEKAHNLDQQPSNGVKVNLAESRETESFSSGINKDNNVEA